MMATKTNQKTLTTKLAVTAMLTAIAVALQYIEFSIPIVPSFLKLDFSDLPELIGTFVLGPWWALAICFLKNLIHIPFGTSGGVGELSNFLLGATFVVVAGLIYQHKKTRKTALIACLSGAAAMAVMSFPTNYFIVYPAYAQMWFGGTLDPVIGMYRALLPAADTLEKALLFFNLPFTLVKGLLVSLITMFIYKPLSNLIVRMNESLSGRKKG
ncbi:MAG: ECF transporter S component [Ruminococcus sp.]|nr:ECF transporter S component [Ruminococcus sp.]